MRDALTTAQQNGGQVHRRGIETRRAIERAAVELFADLGYHATSVQRISSAANIQAAAIYHWFPSKEAVLVHLQNDFMKQLNLVVAEAISRHERPALQLAAAVREHVKYHGLHSKEAFVTDSEIRALTPAPRAALLAKRDVYQDLFHRMIVAGIADGSLSARSSRVAAYAILLQCTGVAMWFRPNGALTLDEVADVHVELALGSLGAGKNLIEEAICAVRSAQSSSKEEGTE